MKIYDISQEVFSCSVYPGDSRPERRTPMRIADGKICNLTEISMCAHNGTHVDAPYHFYDGGKTVDELSLDKLVGYAYVAEASGEVTAEDAERIIAEATAANPESAKRIMLKGNAVVTLDAAKVFAKSVGLIGNESQTVGPENAPAAVHYELLGREVVLLEGLRLAHVPVGVYLLSSAPINLGGSDGAPCRAVLIEL